jgi:hypothetical protein
MQGLFFETDDTVHTVIRVGVMLLCFWTAWMSGKGASESWKNYSAVVIYTVLLTFAVRFIHHALFGGPMFFGQAPLFYVIDFVLLLVFSTAGYRYARTNQMVDAYYWLYEKASPFSWKDKA